MSFGFLTFLFALVCLLLILLVLIQKGKGSMGIGALGGGTQMLFGGSGGQDIFQKATWVLGALFLLGSLFLSVMVSNQFQTSRYISENAMPQSAGQSTGQN